MATISIRAISSQRQQEVALPLLSTKSPIKASLEATSDIKIMICGSQTNPNNEITVSVILIALPSTIEDTGYNGTPGTLWR